MTETEFEGWAILELMGHRRLAGYVTPVELAGAGMLRLDVPGYLHTEPSGEQEERGQATQFYSPAALYCLTPTTEEIARRLATPPAPAHRWELERPALPARVDERDEEDERDAEFDRSDDPEAIPF